MSNSKNQRASLLSIKYTTFGTQRCKIDFPVLPDRIEKSIRWAGVPLGSMQQLEDHTHGEYNEDLIHIPSLLSPSLQQDFVLLLRLIKLRTHR